MAYSTPLRSGRLRTALGVAVSALVLVIAAVQLIPVDRSNPPVLSEPHWDAAATRSLMQRGCFDCHSNETKWPWYSYLAPISWLIAYDVQQGRAEVNYSEWTANSENEALETVLDGSMPPQMYLFMHPEAQLTSAEKQALITGLQATFGSNTEKGDKAGGRKRND